MFLECLQTSMVREIMDNHPLCNTLNYMLSSLQSSFSKRKISHLVYIKDTFREVSLPRQEEDLLKMEWETQIFKFTLPGNIKIALGLRGKKQRKKGENLQLCKSHSYPVKLQHLNVQICLVSRTTKELILLFDFVVNFPQMATSRLFN